MARRERWSVRELVVVDADSPDSFVIDYDKATLLDNVSNYANKFPLLDTVDEYDEKFPLLNTVENYESKFPLLNKIVGFGVTTETDNDSTVTVTVSGADPNTDVALATLQGATQNVYVTKASVTSDNTVTVTLSGNGGTDTTVAVMVIRP